MEKKTKVGDLAKMSKEAESKVHEWLAVLARCFQLQDAIAVLELDRVFDTNPDELIVIGSRCRPLGTSAASRSQAAPRAWSPGWTLPPGSPTPRFFCTQSSPAP